MSKFDEYLIYDGKHGTAIEAENYVKETGKPFPFGSDGVQKIYKFPNGYGASVIKGWFSSNKWEIIVVGYEDIESDDYAIVGDILRFDFFEEVEEILELIYTHGLKSIGMGERY